MPELHDNVAAVSSALLNRPSISVALSCVAIGVPEMAAVICIDCESAGGICRTAERHHEEQSKASEDTHELLPDKTVYLES